LKTYQLKHEEVNHAAGEFVRLKRRGPKPSLSVHTGGIERTWKKIRDKLPPGIHTRKKGKINKDQQSTAGTACCERLCQAIEKASEDMRVESAVDRLRVLKLW
jgi:hypothetical protein